MTDRFYFEKISIRNYRALVSLEVENLKRINVIGGLNGAGKTTILEALFMSLNVGDPTRLARPLFSRGVRPSVEVMQSLLFTAGRKDLEISLRSETRDGTLEATVKSETSYLNIDARADLRQRIPDKQVSQANVENLTVSTRLGDEVFDVSHFFDINPPLFDMNQANVAMGIGLMNQGNAPMGIGLGVHKSQSKAAKLPTCIFIDKKDIQNNDELATRYTRIVQSGNKERIVNLARIVLPDCKDVALLQIGGVSQVCGQTSNDQFLPLSLLGDGASIIVNVGLALLFLRDGILLLDEFDTALHFSRLTPVWHAIARLAQQVNCQIVAVTHSRECIEAAATALTGTDVQGDFQFVRIDRVGGTLVSTNYDVEDLNLAFAESWDVR